MCIREDDYFVKGIAVFFPTTWTVKRANATKDGTGGEVHIKDDEGFWECYVEIGDRSGKEIIREAIGALHRDFNCMTNEEKNNG